MNSNYRNRHSRPPSRDLHNMCRKYITETLPLADRPGAASGEDRTKRKHPANVFREGPACRGGLFFKVQFVESGIKNSQLSTVNCQLSTVNCQLSTVNCQLSTVNCFTPHSPSCLYRIIPSSTSSGASILLI